MSLLGKSTVCSVEINTRLNAPLSYDTIAVGKNSFVLAVVAEVASCDDTQNKAFGVSSPLTLSLGFFSSAVYQGLVHGRYLLVS